MASSFTEAIGKVEETAPEAIIIEINSPGGSIPAGQVIEKAIEDAPVPTVCIIDGDASSMAAQLSQACTTRVITKRSTFMIHEPTWGIRLMGQPTEWRNVQVAIEAQTVAMCELFARRMHATPEAIREKIRGGAFWEMNWREVWEWGAVDQVVDRAKDVKDALREQGRMPPNLAFGIPQQPAPK